MKALSAVLAAGLVLAAGSAAAAPPMLGAWHVSGGRTVVNIAPCAGAPAQLCGALTALAKPLDAAGHPQLDAKNPNPALRTRPILGQNLLSGFTPGDGGLWVGKIYDPSSGNTYDSKFNLAADGDLSVQGCIGILCITQTWTRRLTKP